MKKMYIIISTTWNNIQKMQTAENRWIVPPKIIHLTKTLTKIIGRIYGYATVRFKLELDAVFWGYIFVGPLL